MDFDEIIERVDRKLPVVILLIMIISLAYLSVPKELKVYGYSNKPRKFDNWETERFYWKGEWMGDVDVLAENSGNLEVSITHSGSTNLEYLKITIKSWGDGTVYMLFPEGGPWENVRIGKDFENGYTINEAEFSNLGFLGKGTLTFRYLVNPICTFNYPVEVKVDFVLAEGIKRYKGRAYYVYDFCSQD